MVNWLSSLYLFNLMEGRSIRKIKRIAKTRLIKGDSCEDKR